MAFLYHPVRSAPMSRIPRPIPRQPDEGNSERGSSAPSKLEQLKASFQRKLLMEKSEKMVAVMEYNQHRALARYHLSNNKNFNNNQNVSVRDFLIQRRNKPNGWPTGPSSSGSSTPTSYAGKPPIYNQRKSSGRDRSKPLAPIQQRVSPNHNRTYKISTGSPAHSPKPPPPRLEKQTYVRPQVKGIVKNNGQLPNKHGFKQSKSDSAVVKVNGYQKWQEQQRLARQKKVNIQSHPADTSDSDDGPSQEMSDFQKWQMTQNKERENRLKKANLKQTYQDENENYIINKNDKVTPRVKSVAKTELLQEKNRHNSFSQFSDDEDSDNDTNSYPSRPMSQKEILLEADIIARKEQEMLALLEKKRLELQMIKDQAAEEEKRNAQRQKYEQGERERMRRLQEEEEEKQRQQEEEEEERHRKEQSESRKEYLKKQERSVKIKSKPAKVKYRPLPESPTIAAEDDHTIDYSETIKFYENVGDNAETVQVDLAPCPVCGRKFASDRLSKHIKICSQSSKKKRKVFDPVKMRTEGTDHEKYAKDVVKHPTPVKKKASNWRKKHEEFQRALQYAKKVTAVEAAGGNVADLPPPPPSENPDYKQCPYCERKFNPSAAERHIPWCKEKSLKSKPVKVKNTRNKYH